MLIQCHGVVTLFPHTIFMAISKNQSDEFVDLSELILMELPTVKDWDLSSDYNKMGSDMWCGQSTSHTMYKFCSKLLLQYKGWHIVKAFINWKFSKLQHDLDWIVIITNLICDDCSKHKYLLCIVTIKAFPKNVWEVSIEIASRKWK